MKRPCCLIAFMVTVSATSMGCGAAKVVEKIGKAGAGAVKVGGAAEAGKTTFKAVGAAGKTEAAGVNAGAKSADWGERLSNTKDAIEVGKNVYDRVDKKDEKSNIRR